MKLTKTCARFLRKHGGQRNQSDYRDNEYNRQNNSVNISFNSNSVFELGLCRVVFFLFFHLQAPPI